jgi:hypothetical protein
MKALPESLRQLLYVVILAAVFAAFSATRTTAATININPSKDNTLYQFVASDVDRSNGIGTHLFTGTTEDSLIRRGVIAFDIAAAIPAGSTINSATLHMNMSRANNTTARTVGLYKLLTDWGEGTSDAPEQEGRGAPATTNDATWRHRFFSSSLWTTQGGNFSTTLSASASVGATGLYNWSSAQLAADVQAWLDTPASNFGWLILGSESTAGTAKRFDTRESVNPPVLIIDYTAPSNPPQPVSVVSRKPHGSSGTFDIDLLAATVRTECRTGGAGGNYQVVVSFANPVTVAGVSVTSSNGMATATQTVSGSVVTVDLAGVANVQTAMITLMNVSNGTNSGDVVIPFRVLIGDTNGNGSVTASDIGQVKGQSGQAVTIANFRTDVTANGGSITASDIGLVKSASGTQLP